MSDPRLFVTATGTDVGKTVVSALLAHALNATYWKPVQAGRLPPTDRQKVASLLGEERTLAETYVLDAPLSPDQSAAEMGIRIDPTRFKLPLQPRLVVEGAGGLLVPLNEQFTMLDLALHFKLPLILVTQTGLGTLNHTLLSSEYLRLRQIPLAGWILNGPAHPANRRYLEKNIQAPLLGWVPPLNNVCLEQFDAVLQRHFEPNWEQSIHGT